MKIECSSNYKFYVNGIKKEIINGEIDAAVGDVIQAKSWFVNTRKFKIDQEGTIKVASNSINGRFVLRTLLYFQIFFISLMNYVKNNFGFFLGAIIIMYLVALIFAYYTFDIILVVPHSHYQIKIEKQPSLFLSNTESSIIKNNSKPIDIVLGDISNVTIPEKECLIQIKTGSFTSKKMLVYNQEQLVIKSNYLSVFLSLSTLLLLILKLLSINFYAKSTQIYISWTNWDYIQVGVLFIAFFASTILLPELNVTKKAID